MNALEREIVSLKVTLEETQKKCNQYALAYMFRGFAYGYIDSEDTHELSFAFFEGTTRDKDDFPEDTYEAVVEFCEREGIPVSTIFGDKK